MITLEHPARAAGQSVGGGTVVPYRKHSVSRPITWDAVLALGALALSTLLWMGPASFRLIGLTLAALVVVWAAVTPVGRGASAAWWVALGGLLLTGVIALYPSIDRTASLARFHGILLGIAVLGVAVRWLASRPRLAMVSVPLALVVICISVGGLLITEWPLAGSKGLAFLDPIYRLLPALPGSLPYLGEERVNPNKLAAPLAMFAPLAAGVALFTPARGRRTAWTLAAVSALAILALTQSRTAYLAASGALILLLALRWRWPALLFVPYVVLVAWVLIWLAAPAAVSQGWPTPPLVGTVDPTLETTIPRGVDTGVPGERRVAALQLQDRRLAWEVARAMIEDFPLTGIGLGTFARVGELLYGTSYLFGPGVEMPHAHNLLLQVAVDLGLPGLGFFAVLTVCLILAARRAFIGAPSPHVRGMAAGATCGLLAYYLFGLTDVIGLGEKPGIIFWLLLGILAACARLAVHPAQPAERQDQWRT